MAQTTWEELVRAQEVTKIAPLPSDANASLLAPFASEWSKIAAVAGGVEPQPLQLSTEKFSVTTFGSAQAEFDELMKSEKLRTFYASDEAKMQFDNIIAVARSQNSPIAQMPREDLFRYWGLSAGVLSSKTDLEASVEVSDPSVMMCAWIFRCPPPKLPKKQ